MNELIVRVHPVCRIKEAEQHQVTDEPQQITWAVSLSVNQVMASKSICKTVSKTIEKQIRATDSS